MDQVNVRFTDLDATCRRDIVEKLKFMVPYARHMPTFKLGRWDGKVAFATVGGQTFFNVLDRVLPIIDRHGYSIQIDDRRTHADFGFKHIDDEFLADTLWPAGHPMEGEPIMLREHQVEAINTYLDNPQSLQSISTSAGKAQPLTAKVLVPGGWKLMGDVAVGDEVIAADGSVTRICGVFPQGEKRIFRVTFADGRTVEACPEHLWKAHKATWGTAAKHNYSNWDIVDTEKLRELVSKKTNRNRISVPLFTPDYSESDVPCEIDPYLLGCLLGDGGLRKSVFLSSADMEIVNRVNDIVGPDYRFIKRGGVDYYLGFSDYADERSHHARNDNGPWHKFINKLTAFGLMGLYSHEKFIPDEYFSLSANQRLELVRGLMDTDGTVGRNGETNFSTTSPKLASGMRDLIHSLGGWATISNKQTHYTYGGEKREGKPSFVVRIRFPQPSELFYLLRKKEKTRPTHRFNLRLPITSIEEVGAQPAQCIMIEHPEHLYVTDGFVVTHNTIITGCLSKIVEPYGRSLVIVPGKDLVMQTCKDYVNIGLDTGRYFGDFKEPDHKHTIATWQSLTALHKNNPEILDRILKDCVCVMVDEAHSIKGKELKDFLTGPLANVPLRWGLTGTIPKDDFEFLALLCSIGPKVGEIRADELQEKGILSNCHIHIKQLVDDVAYSTYDAEKQYLSTDRTRVKWIADYCAEIAKNGNTLVLVNSIELGQAIEAELGVPFIYGAVKTSKRGEEYSAINYTDNSLLVATFGVASTGINIPRIFNLIIIEAGRSFTRVIQSIGRGLRTARDKDFVNIYDICSTAKFSKRHLKQRKEYYNDANYPNTSTKITYR